MHLTEIREIVDTGCTDQELRAVKGGRVSKTNAECTESLGTPGPDYPTHCYCKWGKEQTVIGVQSKGCLVTWCSVRVHENCNVGAEA